MQNRHVGYQPNIEGNAPASQGGRYKSRKSTGGSLCYQAPVADWERWLQVWLLWLRPRTSLSVQRVTLASGNLLRTVCKGKSLVMSEPFRPYEKLVDITILGKKFQVPERNSLLRCFQFISPETIPYGRFCWNQDCQYCRVTCQLPDDDEPREMLSCKFIVMPGMEISDLSQELKWCLRSKLPSDAAVSP
jgi:hypothetical protein